MVKGRVARREGERHTGGPSTQARATWPTHPHTTSRSLITALSRPTSPFIRFPRPLSDSSRVRSPLHGLPRRLAISLSPSSSLSSLRQYFRYFFSGVSLAFMRLAISSYSLYLASARVYVASFDILHFCLSLSIPFSHTISYTCAHNPHTFRLHHISVSISFQVFSHLSCSLDLVKSHLAVARMRFVLFSFPSTLPFPRIRPAFLCARIEIRDHTSFLAGIFVSVSFIPMSVRRYPRFLSFSASLH